ncbi:MAG: Pyrroline-5-carboxylate reductase [Elusimicrobia bacterium ADurb.Bin231]|nr:MAG: Pyrroline-5-carboxylate reductase [Elusimicrobia bacterium ADurb.Bin231]
MREKIEKKIGFLGAGNMAEALLSGIADKSVPHNRIFAYDPDRRRLDYISRKYRINAVHSNGDAVKKTDVIFIAVKPNKTAEVLAETADLYSKNQLVISIAAGVKTKKIEQYLCKISVVRSMPNTPALIGKGVFAICPGKYAVEQDVKIAERLLSSCGAVFRVKEKDMDAVTAVSGSGPAYLFYLAEMMIESACELGLNRNLSQKLVIHTLIGSSGMLYETGLLPDELRNRVTSKGGTTEAAFKVIQKKNYGSALKRAIMAAAKKSKQMSEI